MITKYSQQYLVIVCLEKYTFRLSVTNHAFAFKSAYHSFIEVNIFSLQEFWIYMRILKHKNILGRQARKQLYEQVIAMVDLEDERSDDLNNLVRYHNNIIPEDRDFFIEVNFLYYEENVSMPFVDIVDATTNERLCYSIVFKEDFIETVNYFVQHGLLDPRINSLAKNILESKKIGLLPRPDLG